MSFQLSNITIVSNNPLYPNNKVTLTVDNDLNPEHTVVIENSTFPYIVEFINYSPAAGKRYISDWLFKRLLEKYSDDKGKIYNTLQKEFCPYPYITLDYNLFDSQIKLEQSRSLVERDKSFTLLEYVGASIDSTNTLLPENILKWLDLPIIDADGQPIKKFPILINYSNKTDLEIRVELTDRKIKDFFATTYFTVIDYPLENSIGTKFVDEYDKFVESNNDDYFNGEKSKSKKYNKIVNKTKTKSLENILSNTNKLKGVILGLGGLTATALALKNKLDAIKNLKSTVQTPKIPKINFNKSLVTAKIKKSEQKPKKKKRLSGKKAKITDQTSDVKNPAVENLKNQAGNLQSQTQQQLNTAKEQKTAMDAKIEELRKMSNMTPEELIAYKRSQGFKGTITVTQRGSK